jgi:hypothetical protein
MKRKGALWRVSPDLPYPKRSSASEDRKPVRTIPKGTIVQRSLGVSRASLILSLLWWVEGRVF